MAAHERTDMANRRRTNPSSGDNGGGDEGSGASRTSSGFDSSLGSGADGAIGAAKAETEDCADIGADIGVEAGAANGAAVGIATACGANDGGARTPSRFVEVLS